MSVLGALFARPQTVDTVADIITPASFYRQSNGLIYEAILSTAEAGKAVDSITVSACLDASGHLKDLEGGTERIHELALIGSASPNAVHWAKIVRAMEIKRDLVQAGQAIMDLGYEGTGQLEDIVAEADKKMLQVSRKLEHKRDFVYTSKQLVEEFRERMSRPEELAGGIPTPFPEALRPLKGGRLYVLGGYQADGKSVIANQFVRSCCEAGHRAGFASIEMSRADLTDRLVSTFGIPHRRIMEGDLGHYKESVEDALGQIGNWDFEVIDDESLDPEAIRRRQRSGKYELLIVDHLHTIPIRDKRHEREELSEYVRRFRNIAREFDVPVLLLSQLSRGQKHDPYPKPTMADVRGTSAIESEAAMVLFVYRERRGGERTDQASLIVAKNRFGAEGVFDLLFSPRYVRFTHQTGGNG